VSPVADHHGGPVARMLNTDRACLLRAARMALLKLKSEHERLTEMAVNVETQVAADDTALEIASLQRAVAWLWRDQMASDD
jgi:hypothetical protein